MTQLTEISGKIGIIDNDLIMRKSHNFPNLVLMKISNYLKSKGNIVELTDFSSITSLIPYDYYVVSKVFSDTETPRHVLDRENVIHGGSGFYFDKAEKLPHEIEHFMPDYQLYKNAYGMITQSKTHYFKDHSIGFMTRGCVRRCKFCINQNSKKVEKHSELSEFHDPARPFITLLDDNITAYEDFENVIIQLRETGKSFTFKQGMDFRLLNEEKILLLKTCKQYGVVKLNTHPIYIFAFDNYADHKKIVQNLEIWCKNMPSYNFYKVFYVLVGYKRERHTDFYEQDYWELLERIRILFKYEARPYIMMYDNCNGHKYKKQIKALKQYCNYAIRLGNNTLKKYCEFNNIDKNLFTKGELELEYKHTTKKMLAQMAQK